MTALFLSMFTLGLVTSLHCVSMCGPMVVSYALKGTEDQSTARRIVPNLAYQGAKITSYVLVGILLGAIGAAFNLDAVRPYVMVLAGVFMIVMGLGMTGRVPWAMRLVPRPPKFLVTALTRVRRKATAEAAAGESTLATPITFGLLTGLFPCAPLIAAQLSAAATGSSLTGGLAMLAFGLGTAPLMLAFGTASSLIPSSLKERVMIVLAIVVMLFGAVYVNRGLMRLGSPVTFQSVTAAAFDRGPAPAETTEYRTGADGVVEVPLTIRNTQFVPAQVQIPADKPVRLVVDRQEDAACSAQIAVPQLGVLKDLAGFSTTSVDLPASKSGRYTLTCGMGMMSGLLIVGGPVAGGTGSPLFWLLLVLGLAAAALVYAVRRSRRTSVAPAGAMAAATPKPSSEKQSGRSSAAPRSRTARAGASGANATGAEAGLFGLSPQATIVVSALVVAAVVAGLAFGGMFTR